MNMRITIIIAAVLWVSSHAVGQSLRNGDRGSAVLMVNDSLVGSLELDADQRRQLSELERSYHQQYDLVQKNDTLDPAVARQQVQELTAWRDLEIARILSTEQQEAWQRMTAKPADSKR